MSSMRAMRLISIASRGSRLTCAQDARTIAWITIARIAPIVNTVRSWKVSKMKSYLARLISASKSFWVHCSSLWLARTCAWFQSLTRITWWCLRESLQLQKGQIRCKDKRQLSWRRGFMRRNKYPILKRNCGARASRLALWAALSDSSTSHFCHRCPSVSWTTTASSSRLSLS